MIEIKADVKIWIKILFILIIIDTLRFIFIFFFDFFCPLINQINFFFIIIKIYIFFMLKVIPLSTAVGSRIYLFRQYKRIVFEVWKFFRAIGLFKVEFLYRGVIPDWLRYYCTRFSEYCLQKWSWCEGFSFQRQQENKAERFLSTSHTNEFKILNPSFRSSNHKDYCLRPSTVF